MNLPSVVTSNPDTITKNTATVFVGVILFPNITAIHTTDSTGEI
jgi:hypothetical protein